MPPFFQLFTGARNATSQQVSEAFARAGIRVNYVRKVEEDGTGDFLISFPDEAEARRAGDLGIRINGARLRPVLNEFHREPRPYAHVKVPEQSAELPVTWHDGSAQGRLSGELRCTVTALTPLLAGNEQYELSEARDAHPVQGGGTGNLFQVPWFPGRRVHGNRNVLEPLRDDRGRVLISGEQIKGMVRQSIGALLGAPMERVKDQSFSYRPNLVWPRGDLILEPRPAIVREVRSFEYEGRCYQLPASVDIYPAARAIFNSNRPLRYRYRGGMEGWQVDFDGAPVLATRSLHTSAEPTDHVPEQRNVPIENSVHTLWFETYLHLVDPDGGHVSPRHPSLGNNQEIRSQAIDNLKRAADRGFAIGDLIYVEWDKQKRRVVSYGHHYYYRWRYVNTVCRRQAANGTWVRRPEVSPRPAELEQDQEGRPLCLTGVRALFGYTGDNPGSAGIGRNDFTQLAGRVSFNMAVEQIPPGRTEAERFLAPNHGFAVSLQELATPKPSAVEFYVDQSRLAERRRRDRGVVVTYGDLPNWDPPGDLAGRKFYRHNPEAAARAEHYVAEGNSDLLNERATIARFVSTPGTQFRFKVRFRDLSPAELGVLLLALCPDQFVSMLPEETRAKAGVKTDGTAERPRYATKLGHARPLGWGSIVVRVDAAYKLCHGNEGHSLELLNDNVLGECVSEAAELIKPESLQKWLSIHDFRESLWAPYPRRGGRIFAFHAEVRKEHSRGRRQRP